VPGRPMAQLTDDSFAFGGKLMPVDDAVAILSARVKPVEEVETVDLRHADGRILVHDISAPLPLPPFTNSAVDGYAVRSRDLARDAPVVFQVEGRVQAGAAAVRAIAPGRAARIFTGAPMPRGADTVFMQEDVRLDGSAVILPSGLSAGANVRAIGEDIAAGATALQAGRRLRPQDVALAAALGLTRIEARRRIRVAVFSTGDEIVSPGELRGAAQLFDSNRFMLIAMAGRLACDVSDLGILPDDRALLAGALRQAAEAHDLIVTTGGVSTGEEDHVKAAVEAAGSLVQWRMAIKPGRPVAMGVINGTAFIGLPGNPVASFVTFAHVVRPTILALAGAMQEKPIPMPVSAAFGYKKKIGRREYVRVKLRRDSAGVLEAVKFPREGAALLSSLVETDGLIELGEEITLVERGQTVGFLSYASLS
jgi:molybdopterin molybdotransferase